MPTGPQGQVRPSDTIENAILVARIATGEIEEEFSIDNHQSPQGEAPTPEGVEPSSSP